MSKSETEEFIAKLEVEGVKTVRQKLSDSVYGVQTDPFSKVPIVNNWLHEKDEAEKRGNLTRAEKRDEEALAISRSALETAKDSKTWSIVAIIVSVLAILVSYFSSKT